MTSHHRIHALLHLYSALSLITTCFCSSVWSHILYLLDCSEHRYTCCAQTPQIKRSTGSYMSCSARITVRVLDKNKPQICCSERTSGNGIMLDRLLQFKLHQSYRVVFGKLILQRKKSGRDSRSNADLDCCDARLSSVRCVALSRRVQF